MEKINHWVGDWLSARAESERTLKEYSRAIRDFESFCQAREMNFSSVVEEWRAAYYSGAREEQMFLDQWNDIMRAYATAIKTMKKEQLPRYVPLVQRNLLTIPKSFFSFWKIPVDVELPRRACVTYHNKEFKKEQIRMILAKATQRDRTIFLMMAECGLRPETLTTLKYWQIKEDFEKGILPMRILTPSSTIKDHVGDRWSFIGEDGEKTLREYLKPRLPLKGEDYVFASEKPGLVKGTQFTVASLSTKFARITKHLKMEKGSPKGKPGHYRMYGLRKYFRNNMRADPSYREFWMGHSLGVDEHYISRDPEEHRERYAEGYEQLRILERSSPDRTEIEELKARNEQLHGQIEELRKDSAYFKRIVDVLRDPKKLRQFEKLLSEE